MLQVCDDSINSENKVDGPAIPQIDRRIWRAGARQTWRSDLMSSSKVGNFDPSRLDFWTS